MTILFQHRHNYALSHHSMMFCNYYFISLEIYGKRNIILLRFAGLFPLCMKNKTKGSW